MGLFVWIVLLIDKEAIFGICFGRQNGAEVMCNLNVWHGASIFFFLFYTTTRRKAHFFGCGRVIGILHFCLLKSKLNGGWNEEVRVDVEGNKKKKIDFLFISHPLFLTKKNRGYTLFQKSEVDFLFFFKIY